MGNCNQCGKRTSHLGAAALLASDQVQTDNGPMIPLAGYEGPAFGYGGPHANTEVFVVDRNGPNQQLLLSRDDAVRTAKSLDTRATMILAKNLPKQAMVELLQPEGLQQRVPVEAGE